MRAPEPRDGEAAIDTEAPAKPFGARMRRVEDPRYLTGRTTYIDGLVLPHMAAVAFARSDHAHARIRGIDVTHASAHPGVLRVFTGEDVRRLCPATERPMDARTRSVWTCPGGWPNRSGRTAWAGRP